MASEPLRLTSGDTPIGLPLDVRAPSAISVIVVPREKLDTLQSVSTDESTALAFLGMAAGVLVSLILSALTSTPETAVAAGIFTALGAVSAIAAAWFAIAWLRARKARKAAYAELLQAGENHRLYVPLTTPAVVRQAN